MVDTCCEMVTALYRDPLTLHLDRQTLFWMSRNITGHVVKMRSKTYLSKSRIIFIVSYALKMAITNVVGVCSHHNTCLDSLVCMTINIHVSTTKNVTGRI